MVLGGCGCGQYLCLGWKETGRTGVCSVTVSQSVRSGDWAAGSRAYPVRGGEGEGGGWKLLSFYKQQVWLFCFGSFSNFSNYAKLKYDVKLSQKCFIASRERER